MAYNSIARSMGNYKPGEFDLGIHNPSLVKPEYDVDCGALDNPDAYYNFAIEFTRSDNLYRDVNQERNDPLENRIRYNLLADISTGSGPRASVKDLLPSTELLQDVGPPKHEHKPNFEGLRKRFYEASKKRLSKYENMTNIIDTPLRRDMVRYEWNNNPRMRGQIQVSPIDNVHTYLQNHTAQNLSFNDKLMSSLMIDTDIVENLEYKNRQHNKKVYDNLKPTGKNNIIQMSNVDNALDLELRKTKENFSNNKYKPQHTQTEFNVNNEQRTNKLFKSNNISKPNGRSNRNIKNEGFISLDNDELLNKQGRTKIQTQKMKTNANFDKEHIPDERSVGYGKSYDNRVSAGVRPSGSQNVQYNNNYETYEMGYKRPKIDTNKNIVRGKKNNENLNTEYDTRDLYLSGKGSIKNKNTAVRSREKGGDSMEHLEDNIISHRVVKHH